MQGGGPLMSRSSGLSRKELSVFPRQVADVVLRAVNEHGVTYRMLDGGHLRLFTGDRRQRPIKVSAKRPTQATMRRLIPWLVRNVPSWDERLYDE